MTAGLILLGRIWEFTDYDDEVGGAVPSGTIVYSNIQARIESIPTSLTKVIPHALSLDAPGFQVGRNFSVVIQPRPGMNLKEKKHYFQFTSPSNSIHYLKMFRITYVLDSDHHPSDPRRFVVLVLERSTLAHGESYQ